MRSGAFTTVSVLPEASTPITVRVLESDTPFAMIAIGESGHGVTVQARDEETLEALASAIGEARAKLVGALTRVERDRAAQPELPAAC